MKDRIGDKARLRHIFEAAELILEFCSDKNYQKFCRDKLLISAVERQLEIIGEAANRVSDDVQKQYSDVQWNKIIGLRNFIAQEYFSVDLGIWWDIVEDKIPTFKNKTYCRRFLIFNFNFPFLCFVSH